MQRNDRSLARFAFQRNSPVMQLHQFFGKRQSQPRAFVTAVEAAVDLAEALEYLMYIGFA